MSRMVFVAVIIVGLSSISFGYSGGTGDPNNPYQIAAKADLLALAADINDYNKCFILTADISMQGQVFTTAIIAANTISSYLFHGTAFTGTFDGNGHKITDFTINGGSNSCLGLFGQINPGSSVKNLGLGNCAVSGDNYVGGLVGLNYGSISNCYSTGSVSGSGEVGGLVGWNESGTISDCYSTGTVNGGSSGYGGGLVGGNNGSISNCYSMSTVGGGSNSYELGGLVGLNGGSISNCYSTGRVSGGSNSEDVGGLVGGNFSSVSGGFWDIKTSGQTTSAGGTGETTAQMKTLSTFTTAGWDFTNETANGTNDYWRMCVDGVNYPQLNWEYAQYGDFACPDGVDFTDFAYFADRWHTAGCDSSNNFCGGTDIDSSGTVDIQDLAIFAANWLSDE